LKQLQTEFSTELTALKGKIERLDTDVAKLETQQFSTTTKLTGQAIFAINAGTFGGDRIIAPRGAIVSRSQPKAANPSCSTRSSNRVTVRGCTSNRSAQSLIFSVRWRSEA
jgi:hypothetical protein